MRKQRFTQQISGLRMFPGLRELHRSGAILGHPLGAKGFLTNFYNNKSDLKGDIS